MKTEESTVRSLKAQNFSFKSSSIIPLTIPSVLCTSVIFFHSTDLQIPQKPRHILTSPPPKKAAHQNAPPQKKYKKTSKPPSFRLNPRFWHLLFLQTHPIFWDSCAGGPTLPSHRVMIFHEHKITIARTEAKITAWRNISTLESRNFF